MVRSDRRLEVFPSLEIAGEDRFSIREVPPSNDNLSQQEDDMRSPKKILPLMALCVLVWGCPGEPDQITDEAHAEAEEPASTDTDAAADTESKMDAAVSTAAEGTKEGLDTAGDGLKTAGEATKKGLTTAGEATKKGVTTAAEATKKGVTTAAKATAGALTRAAEATKKAVTPDKKDKPDPDQDR